MDETLGQEDEPVIITNDEVKEDEPYATVSLNTVLGDIQEGGNIMRIKGTIGNKTLHILLDTGSSHNFISDKFGKMATTQISEMPFKSQWRMGSGSRGHEWLRYLRGQWRVKPFQQMLSIPLSWMWYDLGDVMAQDVRPYHLELLKFNSGVLEETKRLGCQHAKGWKINYLEWIKGLRA